MNLSMVVFIVACVMEIEACLMLLPALVGWCYGESSAWFFVAVAAVSALVWLYPVLKRPKKASFYAKEGFVATALSWIIMSAIGALPFYLSGQIPSYIDAVFEMVSGFTTTGASILVVVEALDHCMLFWRSFSHWIGGMGVLVFMLAVLPLAGGQNLYLMRAESPGPTVDKLSPKMRSSAAWLYGIYLGLSVICFVLLLFGDMTPFDAACITFGTAGTGGFAPTSAGFVNYNLYCKWVTTVFMLLFGVNFNFYFFLLLRKFRSAAKMEEVRWYLFIYLFAALTILLELACKGFLTEGGVHIVDPFFSVASIMTTTGYATADFNLWPTYSRLMLVLIMFTGACAGSTGGGIKVSRCLILLKAIRRELVRLVHPRSVKHLKIDGKSVDNTVLHNTLVYLAIFIGIFASSVMLVSLNGFDPTTTFTAVAATINNIGPGLEVVGPMGNYSTMSVLSKIVLTFDMLAGRLEIYPVLIFLLPSTWKKNA